MPKSWSEKFARPAASEVSTLGSPYAGHPPGTRMLIPNPAVIAAYVAGIPPGETRAVSVLRDDLAMRHDADFTCPLTAGIFLRIAAELAWEEHLAGRPLAEITPFWRVVDPKSPIAGKLACGGAFIKRQRNAEQKTGLTWDCPPAGIDAAKHGG